MIPKHDRPLPSPAFPGLDHALRPVRSDGLLLLSDFGSPALAHELLGGERLLAAVAYRREVALALDAMVACARHLLFSLVHLPASSHLAWTHRRFSQSLVVVPFVAGGLIRVGLVVGGDGSVGLVVHGPVVAGSASEAEVAAGLLRLGHHPIVFPVSLI